jgi:hypothetical protein
MKGTRETNLGLKAHCHLVIWALFADRCYKKTSSVVFILPMPTDLKGMPFLLGR